MFFLLLLILLLFSILPQCTLKKTIQNNQNIIDNNNILKYSGKALFFGEPDKLTQNQIHFIYQSIPSLKNDPNFNIKKYKFVKNKPDGSCYIRAIFLKVMISIIRKHDFDIVISRLEDKSNYYFSNDIVYRTNSQCIRAIKMIKSLKDKNYKEIINRLNNDVFHDIVIESFMRCLWRSAIIEYLSIKKKKEIKFIYKKFISQSGVIKKKNWGINVPLFLNEVLYKFLKIPFEDIDIDNIGLIIGINSGNHTDIAVHEDIINQ